MFSFSLRRTGLDFEFSIPGFKLPRCLTNDYAFCKDWQLSKNKSFEVQIEGDWKTLIEFSFSYSRKTDHPGFNVTAGFLNRWIGLTFYDHRHWNYDEDRWETDEDRNENNMTVEEANQLVSDVAAAIVLDPSKINKNLRRLKHDELKLAVMARLADMQYVTLASKVGNSAYDYALKKAWWVSRPKPVNYDARMKDKDD